MYDIVREQIWLGMSLQRLSTLIFVGALRWKFQAHFIYKETVS